MRNEGKDEEPNIYITNDEEMGAPRHCAFGAHRGLGLPH